MNKKESDFIYVRINLKEKEEATKILNDLGLNMSDYINMAIKQLINRDGVPFDVVNSKPTRLLKKAITEGEDILDEKNLRKVIQICTNY